MLKRFSDVSALLHYFVLKTIDKELRLKQICHDDIRVANLLISHLTESNINFVFIPVDLVLKVSVDNVRDT